MEAQRSSWPEEELPYPSAHEREARPYPESEKPHPIAVEESGVIASSIKLQGSRSPEGSAEVAEAEQITEKQLELRHEIQDDSGGQSAVSVGSVIAGLPARQPELSKGTYSTTEPADTSAATAPVSVQNDDTNDGSSQGQSSMYRQAIQIGFVTGLCFVILFVLLFMLLKEQ